MGKWGTLLLLLPVVVIAVLVWNYRRQSAAREAASAERMKAFLSASGVGKNPAGSGEAAGNNAGGNGASGTVGVTGAGNGASSAPVGISKPVVAAIANTAAAPAAKSPKPQARAQVATGFTASPLMGATQQAVYQHLQSALPKHAVLPRMSLAAFIQPPAGLAGFALEAERRKLADATVDFLVCDAQLKPLAVVQCACDPAAPVSPQTAFAAACAASTGLRWLSLSAGALPAPEVIRQRVLGT